MSDNDNSTDDSFDPSFITGKDLERYFKLEDALFEFSKLFQDETNDRAMVIVGVTFLDMQLEQIIINFLVDDEKEVSKLLQHNQPLGGYANKVSAAYCFGLIGKTIRDDLRAVGRIRNRFAHDLYASFEDENIKSSSLSLKWHRISYMRPPDDASARDIFNVGVNRLASYLSGVVSIARGHKRSIQRDWDVSP
jgi:DNA-binding MltR family transcriptional regulator